MPHLARTAQRCLCLLLLAAASASALAAGPRLAPNEDETPADACPVPKKSVMQGATPGKGKPVLQRAGSDAPLVRPPRWHSFLPGMFR